MSREETTLAESIATTTTTEYCQPIGNAPQQHDKQTRSLGIIFDLDGTLVAEGKNVYGIVERPGAVEFMRWCFERGHAMAVWTAAHSGWAHRVACHFCQAVQQDDHCCAGVACTRTFDFVWDGTKQRRQRGVAQKYRDDDDCRWCMFYKRMCERCSCYAGATMFCPCRYTKDLSEVWESETEETDRFIKERTLIVENTPQQCIYNYGNAIYVPTYKNRYVEDKDLFERFKLFVVEQLEEAENVRRVPKCSHPPGPHACFEQAWWNYIISNDSVSETKDKKGMENDQTPSCTAVP